LDEGTRHANAVFRVGITTSTLAVTSTCEKFGRSRLPTGAMLDTAETGGDAYNGSESLGVCQVAGRPAPSMIGRPENGVTFFNNKNCKNIQKKKKK